MRRNNSELYVTGIYSLLSVKLYYTVYIYKYQPGFLYINTQHILPMKNNHNIQNKSRQKSARLIPSLYNLSTYVLVKSVSVKNFIFSTKFGIFSSFEIREDQGERFINRSPQSIIIFFVASLYSFRQIIFRKLLREIFFLLDLKIKY